MMMMIIIMDTLHYSDTETALSIITKLNRDQAIMSKLKENLENERKMTSELQDKATMFER